MAITGIEKVRLIKELNAIRLSLPSQKGVEKLKSVKRINEIRVLLSVESSADSGDLYVDAILEQMKLNPNQSGYGLRRVDPEYIPEIGASVPFSYDWDWERDCSSDVQLPGASCIGIDISSMMIYLDNMSEDEENEVLQAIEEAMNKIEKNNYSGEIILVAGDFKGYGDDDGEILIDGVRLL